MVHELADKGFGAAGDMYERGRPSYPADAIAFLIDALGISGARVVDLGAGTGKLTRLLAPHAREIVAIEPVAGMREKLVALVPSATPVNASAENTGLPDGAADVVVAGQAFHWFATDEALAEIRRVLAPGGRLGLIWNVRDESVGWVAALGRLLDQHAADAPRHRTRAWQGPFERSAAFEPLGRRAFVHVQEIDDATLRDRVGSISYVSALPAPLRRALLDEVSALLANHPETRGRARVALPYRTELYWTTRR